MIIKLDLPNLTTITIGENAFKSTSFVGINSKDWNMNIELNRCSF